MGGVNEVSLLDAWATGSRSYTDKTCLRRLETLNIPLVRAGGLSLYSRDFNRQGFYKSALRWCIFVISQLNQYPFLGSRADEHNY